MNKHVEEQLKKELRAAKARVAELERDLEEWKDRALSEVSGYSVLESWNREDAAMSTEGGEGS